MADAKPFSDKEIAMLREGVYWVPPQQKVDRFLATIAARDKRIEELEKIVRDQCDPEDYQAMVVERDLQAATIARMRAEIKAMKDS